MDQSMRIEGVAGPDDVEAEVEPVVRCGLRHPLDHLLRLVARHSVLSPQPRRIGFGRTDGGRMRVELEGTPDDLDGAVAAERALQAALAHVAPGACDVRPDVDAHLPHALTTAPERSISPIPSAHRSAWPGSW